MPDSLTRYQNEHRITRKITSVWLLEEEGPNPVIFYCPNCRLPILQHFGSVVTILPGDMINPLPIIVQCKGRECGAIYYFHQIMNEEKW